MTDQMVRSWCARAQYPDKKPVLFGSVTVRANAPQHEIEASLLSLWQAVSPHPAPPFVLVPGSIFFVGENP